MKSANLSTQDVVRLMEQTDFNGSSQGVRNLSPHSANCTAVAVGVARVLPTENASVVSVNSIEDGLIHSALMYDGTLIDATGRVAENKPGKEAFIPYAQASANLTPEHMQLLGHESMSVDEYILDELITEYTSLSEIPCNPTIAEEAETRFRETLHKEL